MSGGDRSAPAISHFGPILFPNVHHTTLPHTSHQTPYHNTTTHHTPHFTLKNSHLTPHTSHHTTCTIHLAPSPHLNTTKPYDTSFRMAGATSEVLEYRTLPLFSSPLRHFPSRPYPNPSPPPLSPPSPPQLQNTYKSLFIRAYMKHHGKNIDAAVVATMEKAPGTSNPLFLRLCLDELMMQASPTRVPSIPLP